MANFDREMNKAEREAKKAMNDAKRGGKNCFASVQDFFDSMFSSCKHAVKDDRHTLKF